MFGSYVCGMCVCDMCVQKKRWEQVGADLETVKELMRHASITTTMKCYVKPDPRQRRTAQTGLMNVMKGTLESF